MNNATAIDTRLCQIVKLGSNTIKSMVATAINGRHPQRLTKAPVAGIAIIEPIPIQAAINQNLRDLGLNVAEHTE